EQHPQDHLGIVLRDDGLAAVLLLVTSGDNLRPVHCGSGRKRGGHVLVHERRGTLREELERSRYAIPVADGRHDYSPSSWSAGNSSCVYRPPARETSPRATWSKSSHAVTRLLNRSACWAHLRRSQME